jgi:hypothetical protein
VSGGRDAADERPSGGGARRQRRRGDGGGGDTNSGCPPPDGCALRRCCCNNTDAPDHHPELERALLMGRHDDGGCRSCSCRFSINVCVAQRPAPATALTRDGYYGGGDCIAGSIVVRFVCCGVVGSGVPLVMFSFGVQYPASSKTPLSLSLLSQSLRAQSRGGTDTITTHTRTHRTTYSIEHRKKDKRRPADHPPNTLALQHQEKAQSPPALSLGNERAHAACCTRRKARGARARPALQWCVPC